MSVELISVLIAVLAIGATLAGPVGPLVPWVFDYYTKLDF